MKLSTPRWWYVRERDRASMPMTRILLKPLSWIWAAVTARKIARARPVDPGAPVICVGNITMGGTGKTPVVREILARLRAMGVEAQGLSRGYGGRLPGPVSVDLAVHTAADVGDEPLMMAKDGPIWIARDRAAGALAAAAAGARAIVMDDGHQNPGLAKRLSLIVVDGETRDGEWPFGDGAVFPSGPLREPLAAGLARADAVVLMLPEEVAAPDPELLALFGATPVLIARLSAVTPPPPGPQVGFAGVGKPWKVERALKAAGCELADFAPFPDHFAYDAATLRRLAARAEDFGAGLVTTEKDWARLPADWRDRVNAWPVRAKFENEAALDALLSRAMTPAP
ncbi:tetraacyldisaccharide 4'-kinase [Phenylobacterium sp.]|uniref:tetraacyldisaccharide 4'-kinase n=1 Tax=Phenylobacterium sp. TaxID=1871053 RepID=UPI0027312A67|nr:tetraacyldisaccharide 4'-kinase [Phenylobacterium sp.]MDP1874881.1 tetraacyldisaccharide 4'-kinase [Phenylobacterium sp.]MDP3298679.1 tetraacyldisaccharide 4'-kinase [Phenylobacterium sp.]MDP3488702.1 tetraacyldisaccharide 4'-kinase [Phenylobacterium sp.]